MNLKPIEIANKIIELSGINIFENTRKREYVEMRALLCYLLREKLAMRWTNISLFFRAQGKRMDHATAIYAVEVYEVYKTTNKKLEEIEKMFTFKTDLNIDEINQIQYLQNKCKKLEAQLYALKGSSKLLTLINKIPEQHEHEAIQKLDLLIKGWEWKNKTYVQ